MPETLNKEQLEAIKHETGPLLIIAGAGTGKTTVITERIKYLITQKSVLPKEILALTFTEKAAKEMEERIDRALPYGYTQMWVTTFHSFCDRVLRDQALHIGLDPKYSLLTEADTIHFVRSNLFKFEFDYFRPLGNPTKFLGAMMSHFCRLQDEYVTPNEYLSYAEKLIKQAVTEEEKLDSLKTMELAKGYKKYDDLKIEKSYMDFGDLIVKTIELFNKRPNIKKEYQEEFKYLLIDEYQDTNYAQSILANLLVNKDKNINVVGDDDQAVYRFRGAAISNILSFRKHYPNVKVVVLNKNYRSNQDILDKAYNLIQHNNPDRLEVAENIDKKLISQNGSSKPSVSFIHKKTAEEEADEVALRIEELIAQSDYQYKDFAVLVRANNHAEIFMRSLDRRLIPYQFLGPGKLFRQPEIIDLISYLKLLASTDDSIAMYRVLTIEELGIDSKDVAKIMNLAKKLNISIFEACENIDELIIAEDSKEKISKLLEIIKKHLKMIKSHTAGQLLYYFLDEAEIMKKLVNSSSEEDAAKTANIAKLFDKLKSYESNHEDTTVLSVVDWIELQSDLGETPGAGVDDSGENAVNILTIHSSKGLEFSVVFLVNLVSQRFPSMERRESLPIPKELIKEILPVGDFHIQEERRLAYVGMTRAKDKLFLLAADYYGDAKRQKKLSPFVFEAIGEEGLLTEDKKSKQLSFLDWTPTNKEKKNSTKHPIEINYLSHTQIESFKICPFHYYLRYIIKIPTPPSSSQSFGISVHNTLREIVMEEKDGRDYSVKEIVKRNWIKEGYMDKKHQEQSLEKANKIIKEYIDKEFPLKERIPVLLEQPFTVPIFKKGVGTIKIGGKIDRVDELSDGSIEIIDYKTSANIPSQKEVDKYLQLSFYALAAIYTKEPPFNKKPNEIKLSLYFFESQEKITSTRTEEDILKAKDEIFKWKSEIEKGEFHCSRTPLCLNCEFKDFCKSENL